MTASSYNKTIMPVLSLFTSLSTLLCCALPALLVTLGMGAVLAGVVSAVPALAIVSEYKTAVFIFAGVLLVIAVYFQWQSGNRPCPVDIMQKQACARVKKVSWVILLFSIVVYLTGFFFAFVAVHFL